MCVVGVRPRVKAEGVPEAESTMHKVSPPNAEARPMASALPSSSPATARLRVTGAGKAVTTNQESSDAMRFVLP